MGRWKAMQASRGGRKISHLMFADDVVLFAKATLDQARVVRDRMDRFCSTSGQKISTHKASIYFSLNIGDEAMNQICNVLSMPRTNDFGKYFGVPTTNGRVTKAMYHEVIARVDRKLTSWKAKCLSLAGHATLIHAAVIAIPAYTMQTTKIPRSVCDEVDRKMRKFLLGGTTME